MFKKLSNDKSQCQTLTKNLYPVNWWITINGIHISYTCKCPVQSMYTWGSSFAGSAFTRPFTLTPWRLRRAGQTKKSWMFQIPKGKQKVKFWRRKKTLFKRSEQSAILWRKSLFINCISDNYSKKSQSPTSNLASSIFRYSNLSSWRPWIKFCFKGHCFKSLNYTDYMRLWTIKATKQFLFNNDKRIKNGFPYRNSKREHEDQNLHLLLHLHFFSHQEW